MNRVLNADALEGGDIVPESTVWSDYDGDEIYGDFEVIEGSPPTVTELRSYELGIGRTDPWVAQGDGNTMYYHANQIGTTRFMTDGTAAGVESSVYTAFGERVSGTNHRYGYAGTWGYQSHDEFPFMHVGHRYYDPASGRFLQRDPIGLAGGLNVYEYGRSHPTVWIDPTGLFWEPPPPRSEWPKPRPGSGSEPPGFDQLAEDLKSLLEWLKRVPRNVWESLKRLPYVLPSPIPWPSTGVPDFWFEKPRPGERIIASCVLMY